MAIPEPHFVNGAPHRTALARRHARPLIFGMGCFWGAEKDFWQQPGVVSTAVGYAGGFTPNPTYDEVCSGQDRPRRGRSSSRSTRRRSATSSCSRSSGSTTTRRRACARATTSARSTARRSSPRTTTSARVAEASRDMYQERADRGGLRRDHDRDRSTRPASTTPRPITSSTSPRTRTATARTMRRA